MIFPKISIVIPSFNKVDYIEETLKSIVLQDYSNLEVLIQDGGSTDGTIEVIRRFIKKYPKIFRVESKNDKGQLDAINKGFAKSTGQILTYINADDVYAEGAFKEVSEAFIGNPEALWYAGRGIVIDSKGHQIAKPVTAYKNFFLNLNSLFFLLCVNYLMQPSVFLTQSAYEKYGPFSGTSDFITEYDMWLKLSLVSMPVVINKTLSKFRIEANTKTKQMSISLLKEDEKVVEKYTKNPVILILHKLNNWGRILVGGAV